MPPRCVRFNIDDRLLSPNVARKGTVPRWRTSGGAKRTVIEEYRRQGRGGKGVLTVYITARLVGALITTTISELYAVTPAVA